jgi:plastocyanin
MLHFKRPLIILEMVALLSAFLAACQSQPPLATPSAPGISVGITGETCPSVVLQVGQQVTWTNQDSREHMVRDKPAEGNSRFDSGTLQPGDNFAFTFPQPGSYIYQCSRDGTVTGTISVQP